MQLPDDRAILEPTHDAVQVTGAWIWDQRNGERDEGVTCLFRKRFTPPQASGSRRLRISADSRYRVYLNGHYLGRGPCRGTVEHYRYDTYDVSERLVAGDNILAVEVRWYGRRFEPRAEVHLAPGLWASLGAEAGPPAVVTDDSWRVWRSPGHVLQPLPSNHPVSGLYQVVDPPEDVDLTKIPEHWATLAFDDCAWARAVPVEPAVGRYQPTTSCFVRHELVPREIPLLEEVSVDPAGVQAVGTIVPEQPPDRVRRIDGALLRHDAPGVRFWGDTAVPQVFDTPGTHYVVLNMGKLTTGYPRLTIRAPAGTLVEFRYAEALSREFKKAVRDDPEGEVDGYHDLFTCREGDNVVETFVWRTYRFLRIAVHHPDGPVSLVRFVSVFTAYPFRERAAFESSNPVLKDIWNTSWWTARLCAHDHYEDCPYYEQLQYIMDTRLQAMVSYVVGGDFRLARQALRQFAQSRRADGMILARAPAVAWEPIIIPNLALVWVEFLEEFYRYSGDLSIVKELWNAVTDVLAWFDRFERDGLLDGVPYWVFADWPLRVKGKPVRGSTGELNMRRIGALQAAGRLARAVEDAAAARRLDETLERAVRAVRQRLWSEAQSLFCDECDGTVIGEHASVLAVLYDVVTGAEACRVVEQMNRRQDLIRTDISYSYFTFRAHAKVGAYDEVFRNRLCYWTDQLKLHTTTWFERTVPFRSDCHGWSSWIMADLLTHVLGISPAEPGFASVLIRPHVCDLNWAEGAMPTPRGTVAVSWKKTDHGIEYHIALPQGVSGYLVTPAGARHVLSAGAQSVTGP